VRPKTKRIAIPLKKKPTNVVIKRERSDAARHCLLPTDIQTNTLIQLNKYLEKESVADSFWMAQEFVPELIGIGEWRTYFVGGKQLFTVVTEPTEERELASGKLHSMWSLAELTCVFLGIEFPS
jgi:hypothetical protein